MIALWAHPRSLSTAFERVFIERGDFQVFHEPFASCRFAGSNAEYIPFNHLSQSAAGSYRQVRDGLLEAATRSNIFHKDMCYHCVDELLADAQFLAYQTNAFIIRDPKTTILSHAELFPDMKLDAIGYEALYRVFERVRELTGNPPVVIHAQDLASRPDATMKAFCDAAGIAHRADALQWNAGMPAQWEAWREWHSEAGASTAITRNTARTYTVDIDTNPRLQSYYRHHLPFYELLNQQKLRLPVEVV
ncbi:hypothetical protein LJ656_24585 [Paraburkholderia sp. MMS20-SJTR3]|uniref:Sulfotransferase family protein n=1 Tax=Paraburkholderia sejongensis TaxID=2886946 RepID=A0ABS8K0S3_9BURK|nr:hypothetical protein [Paraburkholderia sp. MMS20-SJTR3]MCC8395766.1 hypothetical protein [Paraburkholderia sp. MMS20-SJTR3]